ncbi:MAG: hypothetical protein INQ03_05370 [Candidatus Heimdallarchaeota archaeon]|nr:hypothetical protein [Candidatus Heimdallarchaeota archaeon]
MTKVLVNGTGTIGEPLIALLLSLKKKVGIDDLIFYKHTARITDRPMLRDLQKRGGLMCVERDKVQAFKDIGLEPDLVFEDVLPTVDVVADATKENVGEYNKEHYYLGVKDKVKGFLAQGSEHNFGTIYASGVNDSIFHTDDKPQFVQIASCNTHAAAAAIKSFAFKDGKNNLAFADLTYIRRSSDVSQTRGVQAPTVTAFDDDRFGTHHAKDVWRLFDTEGHDINVFSSALKINSQYMHSLSAHFKFHEEVTRDEILNIIKETPALALTYKTAINQVFSFGRDHGHFGRILNQAVIVEPSIHISGQHLQFWSFTPQDGNAILSSVKAINHYLHEKDEAEELMKHTTPWLFTEV